MAVVDGLKGFPEAIGAVYPLAQVQTCIVHLTRYSLFPPRRDGWKDRQAVARELRAIYAAASAAEAERRLGEFEEGDWGKKYPMIGAGWRRHWAEVIPFYAWAPEIRKILYTTNAIESVNMGLRKVIKNRGHFPNDEAAVKLIWLALRNMMSKWKNPPVCWQAASNQFAIAFEERFKK